MQGRVASVLVRFARLASDATGPHEILDALAETVHQRVGCDAVAVVAIDSGGTARVAAARGLPDEVAALAIDADAIGPELGAQILRAAGAAFRHEMTRPMVAGGNLFGAVIMLCHEDQTPTEDELALADGLIDLAAISLANAAQLEALERSYAELRASQDLLTRTEKLRALGQMAAGVSHDLKNILHPLSLHLQVADRAMAKGNVADARESIAEMRQVVVRGVQTVERLRDYSRQDRPSRTELVSLDELAREAASIAKPRMASTGGGRVILVREELTGPPAVEAVPGDLVSALVNLVVNAIDAIGASGGKGNITLRSGTADGGSYVEVEDEGPGMPPEVQKHIFEPFFTTKGAEGTGLGLAMVDATVVRQGGRITVDTEPGRGTTFRIWFPAVEPPAGEPAQPLQSTAPRARRR